MASTKPEKRQGVDGEAKQGKQGKRAHQGHRHRQQRDQGGAPPLQEQEHHKDDEHQGFNERFLDFLHSLSDGQGCVEGDDVIEVRRKALFELCHELFGSLGGVNGVGAGKLVEGDEGGRFAVEATDDVVGLRSQFDAGDIPEAHKGPVRLGPYDDLPELLLTLQAALGPDRVGELLPGGHRLRADLAGRVYGVLRLDGVDYFRNRDVELSELVGLYPETYGILARTINRDAGNSWHAGHLVVDIDIAIVGEKDVVIGAVG